ncbi:hypothetical protein [Bacillus atrophaeus]|uniref:hypothetical protein n=1 Tax=Bacillus atrophaeus TaxID=1452 RepID=UPI00227DD4BF|nr:hypothetical protein [Bacillus atrophaeus]MCY7866022.1 hypothetical protein [Bacillus spizizenii]MCY8890417.1 hypothetical protein [Bacillus spizizenii]MEC0841872.1 hypothetical protein [Bacillus spizizenii]MED1125238.1 hypothetical protein [Bacillus atrophaeus]
MKLSGKLYKAARKIGKAAVVANDIETLLTLNPKKIAKRAARKATWKTSNKVTRKVTDRMK